MHCTLPIVRKGRAVVNWRAAKMKTSSVRGACCDRGALDVDAMANVTRRRQRVFETSPRDLLRPASRSHVTGIVPQPDHRLREVVLVTEGTQARGAQQEESAGSWVQTEPAGGEHSQEVPARKEQHVSLDGAHSLHHAV